MTIDYSLIVEIIGLLPTPDSNYNSMGHFEKLWARTRELSGDQEVTLPAAYQARIEWLQDYLKPFLKEKQ